MELVELTHIFFTMSSVYGNWKTDSRLKTLERERYLKLRQTVLQGLPLWYLESLKLSLAMKLKTSSRDMEGK